MVKIIFMNPKRIFKLVFVLSIASLLLSPLFSYKNTFAQNTPAKETTQRLSTPPMQLSESTTPATEKPAPAVAQPQPPTIQTTPTPPATPPAEKKGGQTTTTTQGETTVVKSQPSTLGYSPTMVKTTTNYEFIVDASGSMNGPMEMRTKLFILKDALKTALSERETMELKRNVGLRTYGSGSPIEANNCQDTKLEVPIGPIDVPALDKAIDSISAQGQTPLAYALSSAESDFPVSPDADNVIILVTDGADACNGDPCQIASKIHNSPQKIIIQVVGFDLDQKAVEAVSCIAKNSDGQFVLARNEGELKTMINQAINATLPYNLRVKTVSGTTPIATVLTVFKANTRQKIQEDKSTGIKFYKLPSGTYDIEIEYADSIESTKPKKLLKGVEVQDTSKAEQVVDIGLGQMTISALDQNGQPVESTFQIKKAGTDKIIAQFKAGPEPMTTAITPDKYNMSAEMKSPEGLVLKTSAENITVNAGESVAQEFKFQTGKLTLKGVDVANQPIPIVYKITAAEDDTEVTSGEAPKEGITIELAPAKYNIYVQLQEPDVERVPQTKVESIEIKGGDSLETVAKIVTGTLKLSGKDNKGKLTKTNFEIKLAENGEVVAKTYSQDTPKTIHLAPGLYNITAYDSTSAVTPPPSLEWTGIDIKEGSIVEREAIFILGSIKIATMNSKKVMLPGTITIYRSGSDQELLKISTDTTWKEINLTPGLYDIKAEDSNSKEDPKPNVWFHNVEVVPNQSIAKEADFTNGKIKLLCQGKNNTNLTCQFNIFSYGMDNPLIAGETSKSWVEYEIPPGKYYMEAGYHDPEEEVLLKKWINISVDDNQILEQIIRF